MPVIPISIRNKIARQTDSTVFVCGNSDYILEFDFDGEWDIYATKTARFRHDGTMTDVVFRDNICPVPPFAHASGLEVGVFAGNLHTSTPARIYTRQSVTDIWGAPPDPMPSVYDQMMEAFNATGAEIQQTEDGVVVTVRYLGGTTQAFVRHSEVYVGPGDMPPGYAVQVDPSGETPRLRVRSIDGQYVEIPAIKGDKGDKGDPGEPGPAGPRGEAAEGAVMSVNGIVPDAAGNITLTTEQLAVLSTGGGTLYGNLNMNGSRVNGLPQPQNGNEAATKQYVDQRHAAFSAQISTAWTGSAAPYTQVISVPGMLATDVPIVDAAPSATFATAEAQLEAWSSIYRMTANNNSLTAYATEPTATPVPIKILCVRE